MLKLYFDSKDYGVKNSTFYVLDLVCLTSLITIRLRKLEKSYEKGGWQ